MIRASERNEKSYRNRLYSEPKEINKSENTKNTEETQEIFRLLVDIGNNQQDYIYIFKNSQPEKLAYYFCIKHKLDYECLQLLINHIKSVIQIHQLSSSSDSKGLGLSNHLKSSNISSQPNNDNPNALIQNKLGHSLSNSKHNFMKDIINNKYNQLFTNYNVKPALFSTEVYISTNSSPKKAKLTLKLNQIKSTKNTMNRSTQEQKEKKLVKELKSSASQVKITSSKSTKRIFSPQPSPTSSPTFSNRYPLNYGERLYHKGLKIQERTKEKLSLIQSQMSQSNLSTDKPITNMISYNSLSKRLTNNKNSNNEQIILGYKDYVDDKIAKLKEKHKPKENYSFNPKINNKSIVIEKTKKKAIKGKPHIEQRYETLYENYKTHQLKIEKLSNKIYNKDKMFKPSVNQYECAYTSMSFNDRQGYFMSKSIEKQNNTKKQLEMNKDKKTGQAYFKPEINANDGYQRDSNRNIFDELYFDYNKVKEKKKILEDLYNVDFRITHNNVHIGQQSYDIYEGLKERTFKALFKELDKDKDGMINQRNICINALPKTIVHIIEPIIEYLRIEDKKDLSEMEFVANCFQLFDMMSYTEKKEVMNFIHKKKINNPNNFSFKPAINPSASCKDIKISSIMTLSSKCNRSNNNNSNSNKKITDILSNQNEEIKFVIEEENTQEERNDNDNYINEIAINKKV